MVQGVLKMMPLTSWSNRLDLWDIVKLDIVSIQKRIAPHEPNNISLLANFDTSYFWNDPSKNLCRPFRFLMNVIKQSKWWTKLQWKSFGFSRGGFRLYQPYYIIHYLKGKSSCLCSSMTKIISRSFIWLIYCLRKIFFISV